MGIFATLFKIKQTFPVPITKEFINTMPRRQLTPEEKVRSYAKYYYKDMTLFPQEDLDIVNAGAG